MKRRDSLSLLLAGTGLGSLISHRAAASNPDSMENAARIIQKQIDSGTLQSAVLHVQRGKETFERPFGRAITPDSMFLLGPISKPMTATAVMVLSDRGALKLSDPVMKFIPEFSEGARKDITLQHLLTHTSGLPDQLPNNANLRKRHASMADFVQEAVRVPLLFTPGTQYHYQSMGILLAAEVARRVSQTPLPEFLAQHVFTPLGMQHSALGLGKFKLEDTVREQMEHAAPEAGAGSPEARDWDWNSPWWRGFGASWGGVHCSAADVARFLNSFLHPDGKVLREETAGFMIQNHTPGLSASRGIGFAVGPHGLGKGCSDKTFGHTGSTGNLAWADPQTDTTFVLLTSLPLQFSGDLFVHPIGDLVSTAP